MKYFIILTSSLLLWRIAYAENWNDNPNSARQVAKKKGKVIATDILDWHKDKKDIPKDWIKLDNKYFSVSYPKCFTIEGDGGEDDPRISPAVTFRRTESCDGYRKDLAEYNGIGIGYEFGISPQKNLSAISENNVLKSQNAEINGNDAKLFVTVLDLNLGDSHGTKPQLRWKFYLICHEKVISLVSASPRGKISTEKIEKSDYTFPEDFKDIVSTFTCNDKNAK